MASQEYINAIIFELSEMNVTEMIFNTPVIIKKTPHQHLFTAYGVMVDHAHVAVLDGGGEWHETLPNQANVDYILTTILQRIKSFKSNLIL